ncbi:MAG: FtsB family cell division protein [Candidatus Puniceispirillaceae bacterium]
MFQSMRKPLGVASSVVISGLIIVFFGFHTFAGDTGWLAKAEIEREILVERSKLAQLEKENLLQRHRIELLKSHQLDADMLSEIARSKLGLFSAKDVIVSIQVKKL